MDRPNSQTTMKLCHACVAFFRFNINTTAFCLGRSSLNLLLLKSSMALPIEPQPKVLILPMCDTVNCKRRRWAVLQEAKTVQGLESIKFSSDEIHL